MKEETTTSTGTATTTSTAIKTALSGFFGIYLLWQVHNYVNTQQELETELNEAEVEVHETTEPQAKSFSTNRHRKPRPNIEKRPPPQRDPIRQPAPPRRGGDSRLSVDPSRELLITDLSVIEDPVRTDPANGENAVWTFKHLMENMAGEHDPAEFTLQWLQQWEINQTVNGQVSPARPDIRPMIIDPWLAASGGVSLDLSLAPFQLLAIVNRIDLRVHDEDSVTTAGEGRFVFGVLNEQGEPLPPIAGDITGGFIVIFEYELMADDMRDLDRWARKWHELGRHKIGSDRYNRTLESITRNFTDAGKAPLKVNGNSINQIRTNEVAIGPNWELREFVLDAETGLLKQHTVAQTPDTFLFNGTEEFAQLVNENQEAILDGSFSLPKELFGPSSVSGPFLPTDFADFEERTFTKIPLFADFVDIPWSAEGIIENEARHTLALNTCNGCHRSETNTNFLQIGFPSEHNLPESLGNEADLAGFLTGIDAPDPVLEGKTHSFNDLDRRKDDLKSLLEHIRKDGNRRPPRKSHRPKFIH
jgi:hypothetical protein